MATTKELEIPVRVKLKGFWAKTLLLSARSTVSAREHKRGLLTSLEFICFIAGLFFISFWSVPIAGVIGAVLMIVAIERQ